MTMNNNNIGKSLRYLSTLALLICVSLILAYEMARLQSVAERTASIEARLLALQTQVSDAAQHSPPETTRTAAEPTAPSKPVPMAGAITKGNASARIALIEFTDAQCPFCGKYARDTFDRIDKEFVTSGRVLYALRNFPLESIHPAAFHAAEGLEWANDRKQAWAMHRLLFANQQKLDDAALLDYAVRVGLDPAQFQRCLDGGARERVRKDIAIAADLNIHSTPTFLIGTIQHDGSVVVRQRIAGSQSFDAFRDALAIELANKG
jgi:protein-disulfide isomerase